MNERHALSTDEMNELGELNVLSTVALTMFGKVGTWGHFPLTISIVTPTNDPNNYIMQITLYGYPAATTRNWPLASGKSWPLYDTGSNGVTVTLTGTDTGDWNGYVLQRYYILNGTYDAPGICQITWSKLVVYEA